MDPITQQIALASAGAGGAGEALYVDDVFSTFLYEGDQTNNRQITNGIDLSGEGGLTWIKSRTSGDSNVLYDTERTGGYALRSESNGAELSYPDRVTFNSDGFDVGIGSYGYTNDSQDYVSWSFRKAPGFFDVVTYTGNGTADREIAHNLGSVPGCIIIKGTSINSDWIVYHRSLGATYNLRLNKTDAAQNAAWPFNNIEPTASVFTVSTDSWVNNNGSTYVAYVFAHDDQSFGTDEDEAIIKCGAYTGTATSGLEVDLGFEPQWLMMKRTGGTGDWYMFDDMRGWGLNDRNYLEANTSDAEAGPGYIVPTATGFKVIATGTNWNANNEDYIYVAIRRPHKPPTAATEVFAVAAAGGFSDVTSNFPVDAAFQFRRSAGSKAVLSRLTGKNFLEARNNSAETSGALGWYESNTKYLNSGLFSADSAFHLFKRAPGFMDVATYTGTSSNRTVSHNLAATPELIIIKDREATQNWRVYSATLGATKYLQLNGDGGEVTDSSGYMWNSTSPTSTQFSLGISNSLNGSSKGYIAYLFATLDGISKVGSYSGTGNDVDVDCGFSAGARFVMIKRTNSTGDWYFYDTARGIASGNDPYIVVPAGGTTNEVTNTDYIDPLNSGFTVTSSAPAALNASGGTYIFLAIA